MNATLKDFDVSLLAPPIAAALGTQWTAITAPERDYGWSETRLTDGTRTLRVAKVQGNAKRLVIRGDYSNALRQQWRRDDPSEDITVDPSRAPDAIAREITRRLLPVYDANVITWTERLNAHNAYENAVKATAQRAIAALPGATLGYRGDGVWCPSIREVRVTDGRVELVGLTLTVDELEQLGAILRQRKAED